MSTFFFTYARFFPIIKTIDTCKEAIRLKTEHLGKHISMLYRYSQIYFNAELKKYHLGSGQYIFLLSLIENEGINQEQLSTLVKIDKTTTARAVAKLVKEGYIHRVVSTEDRRAYILHATEKGRHIAQNLETIMDKWNATLLRGFSAAEKKQLRTLLNRSIQNILQGT